MKEIKTALVIDDNRLSTEVVCKMLESLGVSATQALGPRAALMMLEKNIPDVIFLDLTMPGVSGFEVLGYLKREPHYVDIPVVVVTMDERPQSAEQARQEGALDVIIKPVTTEALQKAIQAAAKSYWP